MNPSFLRCQGIESTLTSVYYCRLNARFRVSLLLGCILGIFYRNLESIPSETVKQVFKLTGDFVGAHPFTSTWPVLRDPISLLLMDPQGKYSQLELCVLKQIFGMIDSLWEIMLNAACSSQEQLEQTYDVYHLGIGCKRKRIFVMTASAWNVLHSRLPAAGKKIPRELEVLIESKGVKVLVICYLFHFTHTHTLPTLECETSSQRESYSVT